VREDASGDSEDGEDDKLPCVIGESALLSRNINLTLKNKTKK